MTILTLSGGMFIGGCGAESGEPVGDVSEALVTKPMYRGFLPDNRGRDHFYTDNLNEIQNAANNGWANEGARFAVATDGSNGAVPLLRYWSAGASDHFYTDDPNEGLNATHNGYVAEKPAGYDPWVFTSKVLPTVCPVYRAYSAGGTIDHFYTMSPTEYANALKPNGTCSFPCKGSDYVVDGPNNGVAFFAFPYNATTCPP
jgi:hypothetical protein